MSDSSQTPAKMEKPRPAPPLKKKHLRALSTATKSWTSSLGTRDDTIDRTTGVISNDEEIYIIDSIAVAGNQHELSSAIQETTSTQDGDIKLVASTSSQDTTILGAISEAETVDSSANDRGKLGQNYADEKAIPLTGVGREVVDENRRRIFIDEAEWSNLPLQGSNTFPIKISSTRKQSLTISGPLLLKAFDVVLKHRRDPYITKSDDSISLNFPYVPLFFQYREVINAAKRELESNPNFDNKELQALQYWYERWVLPVHTKIQETIKSGWVTYEDIWALFRPGDVVFSTDKFSQPRLHIIAATELRNNRDYEDSSRPPLPFLSSFQTRRFALELWSMNWDSSIQIFKREKQTEAIKAFSGSRRVTDLEFYPIQFYKDGNQEAIDGLLANLKERGHQWKPLVSEVPACMHHNGPATEFRVSNIGTGLHVEKKDHRNLNERVVVDHAGYRQFGEIEPLMKMNSMVDLLVGDSNKEQPILGELPEEVEGTRDTVSPTEPFSDLQAQLCPSAVYCCAPRTGTWYEITIANLKPVAWQKDAIEALVLENEIKQTLCELVDEHKRGRLEGVMTDFIQNKGQGLVLVLHGPPGVGKSLTAESIAEYTEKPLYSINISELSSEQNVVARLEKIFELSVRWDAVLLIDEADVVLEKRSYENMHRNAVVSVFLRMLEYYRGILFLTTNRLGTMDVAFQSRVSFAFRYNALTPELRRQIWLNFINRLDKSETTAKKELTENLESMKEWELNGRQIRNILRMSQSIALSRGKRRGAMNFAIVEQVANETLGFQGYFDEEYRESRSKLGDLSQRRFREKLAPQPRGIGHQ